MRWSIAICAVMVTVSTAAAADPTPRERAQAVLDAQVAALEKGKAGRAEFVGTFDAKAVYASVQVVALSNAGAYLNDLTGELPPPNSSTKLSKTGVENLEVGGNGDAVWFTCDLTMTYAATPGQSFSVEGSYKFRISELLAADRGWKPVVIHVYRPSIKDDWQEPGKSVGKIVGGAKPGPLAKLALSPGAVLKSLAKNTDVFAYGTLVRERFVGEAAVRKQLAGWAKLKLAPGTAALEDSGKGWAYAVTDVRVKGGAKKELPMRVIAFALPGDKKTFQVVLLGYNTAY